MTKLEYTFKTDTLFKMLFKMLFVQYPHLLKNLVSALLAIPLESIERLEINNPDMHPDNMGEKFCRLDINMTINGQRVDLEIQVDNKGDYPERILYYWARDYSSALPEGGDYKDLPRTIVISIIDFNLFTCPDFHSEFCPLTEEDLEKIKALEVPVMEQAINAYKKITVTPEFRELERQRSYARHNEAAALRHAREEGETAKVHSVARNAMAEGASLDFVQKITGLDMETIKGLGTQ